MDGFSVTVLDKVFDIEGIITVHYFEFGKNYLFMGERHNFWEIVYIDKGEAFILADEEWYNLQSGMAVFHKPMQFHNIKANGTIAPNAAVITFVCNSPDMAFFDDLITELSSEEKNLIAKIVTAAKDAFITPLDDLFTKKLDKSGNAAAEQLIKLYLEELLLTIYMRRSKKTKKAVLSNATEEQEVGSVSYKAIQFMNDNMQNISHICDIANALALSESELKRTFKRETGVGVMTYFRNIKIHYAKQILRSESMNITEISDKLGYNSIHHFSREFKNSTGMSPREYAKSIKLRLDGAIQDSE